MIIIICNSKLYCRVIFTVSDKKSSLKIVAISTVLVSQYALATDNVAVLDTISLSPIDSAVQLAHEQRQESDQSQVIIYAEQLNQFGDQPLGDALRRVVGISFSGANRAREVQLRGMGSEYVQVLINGRRLLDASSKRSVQLDRIPSSLVEKVEINLSPVAKQEGQGAAGTINLVLKKGSSNEDNEIGLGAGYLEHNGAVGDVTLFKTIKNNNLTFNFAGGLQLQRRNESQNSMAFDSNYQVNGGELNSNKRRFEQGNFLPSMEWIINDKNQLNLQLDYLQTTEFRDDITSELTSDQSLVKRFEVEDRKRKRKNIGLFSDWIYNYSDDTEIQVKLDLQKAKEETTRHAERFKNTGILDRKRERNEDINLSSISPNINFIHKINAHTLEWGTGGRHETRKEKNNTIENNIVKPIDPTRTYKVSENIFHFYGQDTWVFDTNQKLTYGLRLENSTTKFLDVNNDSDKKSKLAVLPSIQYALSFDDNKQFRMGIAKTLRRPDLRELSPTIKMESGTITKPDTVGNPMLNPESIWGIDSGLDYYFYDMKGLLSSNLFYRHFDNKIETVLSYESGRWVNSPINAGTAQVTGIELEARIPLDKISLPQMTIWSNATWAHSRLKSQATNENRPFLEQPKYLFNIGADYFVDSLRTTIGIHYNWNDGYNQYYRMSNGGYTSQMKKGFGRLDLSTKTQISKNTSLNISILNLLAKSENTSLRNYDTNAHFSDLTLSDEDTYRSIYLRLQSSF